MATLNLVAPIVNAVGEPINGSSTSIASLERRSNSPYTTKTTSPSTRKVIKIAIGLQTFITNDDPAISTQPSNRNSGSTSQLFSPRANQAPAPNPFASAAPAANQAPAPNPFPSAVSTNQTVPTNPFPSAASTNQTVPTNPFPSAASTNQAPAPNPFPSAASTNQAPAPSPFGLLSTASTANQASVPDPFGTNRTNNAMTTDSFVQQAYIDREQIQHHLRARKGPLA